jgi:hypothetical protein
VWALSDGWGRRAGTHWAAGREGLVQREKERGEVRRRRNKPWVPRGKMGKEGDDV